MFFVQFSLSVKTSCFVWDTFFRVDTILNARPSQNARWVAFGFAQPGLDNRRTYVVQFDFRGCRLKSLLAWKFRWIFLRMNNIPPVISTINNGNTHRRSPVSSSFNNFRRISSVVLSPTFIIKALNMINVRWLNFLKRITQLASVSKPVLSLFH